MAQQTVTLSYEARARYPLEHWDLSCGSMASTCVGSPGRLGARGCRPPGLREPREEPATIPVPGSHMQAPALCPGMAPAGAHESSPARAPCLVHPCALPTPPATRPPLGSGLLCSAPTALSPSLRDICPHPPCSTCASPGLEEHPGRLWVSVVPQNSLHSLNKVEALGHEGSGAGRAGPGAPLGKAEPVGPVGRAHRDWSPFCLRKAPRRREVPARLPKLPLPAVSALPVRSSPALRALKFGGTCDKVGH